MRFWKENSYYINRLIVTHIGMSVFGLVLLFVTNQISAVLMLLAGLFSTVFFGALIYVTLWEKGAKDKAAIDAGRNNGGFLHGYLIAVCGEWIVLLMNLLYLICVLCVNVHVLFGKIGAVLYTILTLADGCYVGAMFYINPRAENIYLIAPILILSSLFVALFGGVGYLLGTKEIQLFKKSGGQTK